MIFIKKNIRKIYQLKAFTLIELVVAMIISSIVVLTAYESYTITTTQCSDYKKKSTLIGQSYQLNMVLTQDCFNASTVWLNNDSSLVFKADGNPDIAYIFRHNYILRQTDLSVQDTFYFAVNNMQVKMEPNTMQNNMSLVDDLSFEVNVLGEKVFMRLRKEYGADVLMMVTANKN
jgi:prepilin-type N-terminal cleavage/methylation domain-containing protein